MGAGRVSPRGGCSHGSAVRLQSFHGLGGLGGGRHQRGLSRRDERQAREALLRGEEAEWKGREWTQADQADGARS